MGGLSSQIQHMDIFACADVISQIPADMIGIIVDHDIVIVPKPAAAIVIVVWRDLEEEAANIEPVSTAAAQAPNVPRAKAGSEMPVLPGMVEMIVGIVAARIVANPAVIFSMHVGSLWMAFLIAEGAVLALVGRTRWLALLWRL